MTDKDKNKRWSNYWKQGHITSFGSSTPDNYSAGVKTFWFSQFKFLRNNSTILDTATGNGAIAVFAVEYSEKNDKNFTVLASDAAVINNSITEESQPLNDYRNKIQFFSSTPCEKLPFDNSSIDLVCSQFGIEYSNLHESIPEVSRVLTNGGKFVAVMHHYLSVIVLNSLKDKSMLKEALYEYKIFDILQQYSIDIGVTSDRRTLNIARQKPEVYEAEKTIRETIASLKEKYPNNELIDTLWDCINNFAKQYIGRPITEQLSELEKIFNNFQGTIARQCDLQDAALSKEAIIKLNDLAIKSGFTDFTYEPNKNSSFRIGGWNVCATKK